MFTAFQANSYQSSAFQIVAGDGTSGLLGGTPAGPNVNPNASGFFYETAYQAYQREQASISKKQESIIALKLEAQDNLLRQKELSVLKDKQSLRQVKALEREKRQLEKEQNLLLLSIDAANQEISARQLVAKNNLAMIVLMGALPYLNISIGVQSMH